MCRNIKTLFNIDPPATEEEIYASALQFVRKVSGYRNPSKANQAAFEQAAKEVAMSRKYGGIHYAFSNEGGASIGKQVGAMVLEKMKGNP